MFEILWKDVGEILGRVCKMERETILKTALHSKHYAYVCVNFTEIKYLR